MKKLSLVAVPLVLLALVVSTACDDDSGLQSPLLQDGFQSAELSVFAFDDALEAVGDATIAAPMAFAPDLHRVRPRGHGPDMGPPLRALGLDADQRLSVLDALQAHRECVRGPIEEFRAINQETLEGANQQRIAIMEAFRNGEMTREEARARLRELSQATREAIRANPANVPIRAAFCDCTLDLFATVRSVLDPEQRSAWDDWVAGLPGECFQR